MKLRNITALPGAIAAIVIAPSIVFAADEVPENPGTWLGLLFFAINFALFVAILVYFVAPMARGYFHDRATEIRSLLDRLNSALKEAEDYANRAAARMAQLDQELAQLGGDLEAETAFLINKIREGSLLTAQRIRRDTQLTGVAVADAAQRRVRERLAATATALARDLIANSIQASDQARLVDSFMEKISHEAAR